MSKKVLALVSGGADSLCSMDILLSQGYTLIGLFFDYNQPNLMVESFLAEKYCSERDILFISRNITSVLKNQKPFWLTDEDAFVPVRNTLFLCLAMIEAVKYDITMLCIGQMKQDVTMFDNTSEHHRLMSEIFSKSLQKSIEILTPCVDMTKKDIMQYLNDRNIVSVSCWNAKFKDGGFGTISACGRCLQCQQRGEIK